MVVVVVVMPRRADWVRDAKTCGVVRGGDGGGSVHTISPAMLWMYAAEPENDVLLL